MTRTFIEVPLFTKRWKEIGLDDEELQVLQIMLLKDPESGPIMEGTGGIRKVRFPIENRGKRDGYDGHHPILQVEIERHIDGEQHYEQSQENVETFAVNFNFHYMLQEKLGIR